MMNKKIKVAVIDDEQEILDMIEKYLSRTSSFEVTTFSNPHNAISRIDKSYDVILLDIMMPQMGGLDVLKTLHEKVPELKIIMMTAYSTITEVTSRLEEVFDAKGNETGSKMVKQTITKEAK